MALPSLPPCVFVWVWIAAVSGSGIDRYRYQWNPPTPRSSVLPRYLLLPMFLQQPAPFTSKALFSPSVGRRLLPSTLENILIPERVPEAPIRALPATNDRGVAVWCGYSKVSVRVNLARLGFRSSARYFRFGTCEVSRADGSFIYFHHHLHECGGSFSIVNEQLIYSNHLLYKPDPHGLVIRALPLMLHIQCVYNRFHYSYKIGYIPEVAEQTFRKRLGTKGVFSLSVYNEMWEKLSVNESFPLGEPMNFEASVDFMWQDQRLFVESCHATASTDPNSSPRYDLITNFGCLLDSVNNGSRSRFILQQKNILRFSIDAFLFPQSSSEMFYLHCSLSVGNSAATSTAKSCTYSQEKSRWEELKGDANICNCCYSSCVEHAGLVSVPSSQRAMVTSDAWSLNLHRFLLQESGEDFEAEVDEVEQHDEDEEEEVVEQLYGAEEEEVVEQHDEDEEEVVDQLYEAEVVEGSTPEEVLIANEDCENNTMMGDQQAEDDARGNMMQQDEENMKSKSVKPRKQHVDVLIGELKNSEDQVIVQEQERALDPPEGEGQGSVTLEQKPEEVTTETKDEDDALNTLEQESTEKAEQQERERGLENQEPWMGGEAKQGNEADLERGARGDAFLQGNVSSTIPGQEQAHPLLQEEIFLQFNQQSSA